MLLSRKRPQFFNNNNNYLNSNSNNRYNSSLKTSHELEDLFDELYESNTFMNYNNLSSVYKRNDQNENEGENMNEIEGVNEELLKIILDYFLNDYVNNLSRYNVNFQKKILERIFICMSKNQSTSCINLEKSLTSEKKNDINLLNNEENLKLRIILYLNYVFHLLNKKYRVDSSTGSIPYSLIQELIDSLTQTENNDIFNNLDLNFYTNNEASLITDGIFLLDKSPSELKSNILSLLKKSVVPNYNTLNPGELNVWFSSSHGAPINNLIKLPSNVVVIVISPINRFGYLSKMENIKKNLVMSLFKELKEGGRFLNNDGNVNLMDVLKYIQNLKCFSDSHVFLPNQEMYDMVLQYNSKEKKLYPFLGLHDFNKSEDDNKKHNGLFLQFNPYEHAQGKIRKTLNSVIQERILENNNNNNTNEKLHIYFVGGCNIYNLSFSNYFIEKVYIYYNFIKLLNNSIINSLLSRINLNFKLKTDSEESDCYFFYHTKKHLKKKGVPNENNENMKIKKINEKMKIKKKIKKKKKNKKKS